MPTLAAPASVSVPAWVGALAALGTVTIWGAWIVATRHAVTTDLGPADVGLLRFGVPALLLAPFWLRCGLLPQGVPSALIALMVAGSGAPFFLLASAGMTWAPAAHAGAMLPGTMPLWTALIGAVLLGERIGWLRALGYAAIGLGVATIAFAGGSAAGTGHALMLAASALWAGYTHAFRRSGLGPLEAAGLIGAWSVLLLIPAALVVGSELAQAPAATVALQTLTQGGLSGFLAIVLYGIAVRSLGSTRAAAFSALAPVLAAVGGVLMLGETPGTVEIAAVATVTAGVALASGVFRR